MQFQSIIALLSIVVTASAIAIPNNPPPTCSQPGQVLACCSSFSGSNGVNCIFSTLNVLNPTCAASQSLACCNAQQ
ncbi:hypothetical protein MMC30_009364, partial [Trapelia coarctata]|nr:hypothetical protein [Trapelia coarctata]